MSKNGTYMYVCQNVVETCWKHGAVILRYLLIFLLFNLIKTAAKFLRTESVKCPACAVFAKSRARQVHDMSLIQVVKVSKGAKIRNQYNQVPHLTQDTNGKWQIHS